MAESGHVAAGDPPATDGSIGTGSKVLMAGERRGRVARGHACPDRDQERGLRGPDSRVVWHGEKRLSALETKLAINATGIDKQKIRGD